MLQCDTIATGIVEAVKTVNLKVPLVVRLAGTNVELGKKVLRESGVAIIAADDLDDVRSHAFPAYRPKRETLTHTSNYKQLNNHDHPPHTHRPLKRQLKQFNNPHEFDSNVFVYAFSAARGSTLPRRT